MPPRQVPLAYAGRKLTGPPEGYDKKKELQVKKWLSTAQADKLAAEASFAVSVSVASVSELGGPLDTPLDELYRELRDSTDGALLQVAQDNGQAVTKPPKQKPRPVEPVRVGQTEPSLNASTSSAKQAPPQLGAKARYDAVQVAEPVHGHSTVPEGSQVSKNAPQDKAPALISSAGAARDGSAMGFASSDGGGSGPTLRPAILSELHAGLSTASAPAMNGNAERSPAAQQAYNVDVLRQSHDHVLRASTAVSQSTAAPLDLVAEELLRDPVLRGKLGMALDSDQDRQSVMVSAGLLVARAEAALAACAVLAPSSESEVDKYKAALLMAVREKQRLSEDMRGELAIGRAAATAATQDAAQKAATAAADAAAAAQRAATAEAELARARAEVARLQQEVKARRMEVDDREEDHQAEVTRLQGQVADTLARLTAHGDSRETALRSAQEEVIAARQAAAVLDKQLKTLRRQYDLDKSRLDIDVASLKATIAAMTTDMNALRREKVEAMDAWKSEVAARLAAEESEKKALEAAAKQTELAASLSAMRQTAAALKQQASAAAERNVALKSGAAGAVMPPANTSSARKDAGGANSNPPGTPNRDAARSTPGNAVGSLPGAAGGGRSNGADVSKAVIGMDRNAVEQEFEEVEIRRLEAHRALTKALASERAQIGEVQRLQKRALLAAQLEDSKAASAALAAAPEHLRLLGLAFRAFILSGPSSSPSADSAALGPGLAAWLCRTGYRSWLDPMLMSRAPPLPPVPGLDIPPSCPLVPLSGAVVMIAQPGLLSFSSAHAAVVETAAEQGIPLHIITTSQGLTLEQLFTESTQTGKGSTADASKATENKGQIEQNTQAGELLSSRAIACLKSAWDQRLYLSPAAIAVCASTHTSTISSTGCAAGGHAMKAIPEELVAVCGKLGISDPELLGVSPDVLRTMSIEKNLKHPDLLTLQSSRVTHLKVMLTPAPSSPPPAAAGSLKAGAPMQSSDADDGQTTSEHTNRSCGMSVKTLVRILSHNTCWTAVTLRGSGATASAARAVCKAVADSPNSRVTTIAASCSSQPCMELPVGGLLGTPGVPPIQELDLSEASEAFTLEAAAVLDEALGHESSAARKHLTSINLPAQLSASFNTQQGQQVASQLASTMRLLTQPGQGVLTCINRCRVARLSPPQSLPNQQQKQREADNSQHKRLQGGSQAEGVGAASNHEDNADGVGGVLDLSGEELGPLVAGALFNIAQSSGLLGPQLSALNLTACRICPGGAAHLAQIVAPDMPAQDAQQKVAPGKDRPGLKNLKVVCVADNKLGPEGVQSLISGAILGKAACSSGAPGPSTGSSVPGSCAVTVLDLSLNALTDAGVKVLAGCMISMTSLEVLCLSHNLIQVEGARNLATALAHTPQLQDLQLAGNNLGDSGVATIAAALTNHQHIRTLNLQDNFSVSVEGAKALGKLLSTTTCLRNLHLSSSHLGVEGGKHLASGLATNTSLTTLDISRCKLKVGGVTHIAAAIKSHPSLSTLLLEKNGAGDLGAKALVEALQSNKVLTSLDLRCNAIGLVGCRLLSTLLKQFNNTLRDLRLLRENNQDPDTERPLFEALERLAGTPRTLPLPAPVLTSKPQPPTPQQQRHHTRSAPATAGEGSGSRRSTSSSVSLSGPQTASKNMPAQHETRASVQSQHSAPHAAAACHSTDFVFASPAGTSSAAVRGATSSQASVRTTFDPTRLEDIGAAPDQGNTDVKVHGVLSKAQGGSGDSRQAEVKQRDDLKRIKTAADTGGSASAPAATATAATGAAGEEEDLESLLRRYRTSSKA